MKSLHENHAEKGGVTPATHTDRAKAASSSANIFVLIDALGWRFVENRDFLNDLLPYRNPVRTVLGFSSGAIPTMLTGAPPSVTGHWNLFYYDPKGSPFRWLRPFLFLPDWVLDNRYSTKILKEMGRRLLGLGPLFECCVNSHLLPFFNWVEKKNIYGPGGISGSPSIFDRMKQQSVRSRVYTYHDSKDEDILTNLRHDLAAADAAFFFVYLSEMDMFLHMNCDKPDVIDAKIAWYGEKLREVFELAGEHYDKVSMTLLSDHGMTPIANHYDLLTRIENLDVKMPKDFLAVYDSTMARFWFFNDRARTEIMSLVTSTPCGHVLSDDELRHLGILFEDRRFGEVIYLLDPAWIFSKSDFNGTSWKPVGMHGYHPDDSYSDAIFLSNRKPSAPVITLEDVFRTMREAAGV